MMSYLRSLEMLATFWITEGLETASRGFIRSGAARFAAVHGASYWRAELRRQVAAARRLYTWLGR